MAALSYFILVTVILAFVISWLASLLASDYTSDDRQGSQGLAKFAAEFVPKHIRDAMLNDWLAVIEQMDNEDESTLRGFIKCLGFIFAGLGLFNLHVSTRAELWLRQWPYIRNIGVTGSAVTLSSLAFALILTKEDPHLRDLLSTLYGLGVFIWAFNFIFSVLQLGRAISKVLKDLKNK